MLVYDADTRAIISPLLSVAELRSLGVTLNMAIDAPRDAIPDVAAVYFVAPTQLNLRRLVDDAAAGRYRDFYVNFSSPCGRQALEVLARGCVEAGAVARVRRVCDQYLSYTALEHRLFTLGVADSYAGYAAPGLTEAAIETYARSVAQGLLAVFATIGSVPLIVSARGGPSEMVARLLDSALRDHLASGGGVFSSTAGSGGGGGGLISDVPILPGGRRPQPLGFGVGSRPVLVLLDRGLDLGAPLAHASTYEALVDDTLGPIHLNRVMLPPEGASDPVAIREGRDRPRAGATGAADGGKSGGGGWLEWASAASNKAGGASAQSRGKPASLDGESDAFWSAHAHAQFPDAIEAHHTELASVVAREAEIRRSAGGGGATLSHDLEDAAALAALPESLTHVNGGAEGGGGGDLASALDVLPALLRRKKVLETHTALLQAVMDRVVARTIPHFYEAEVAVVAVAASGGIPDLRAVLTLVSDGEKGSFEDRLRLACVYLLSTSPEGSTSGATGPSAGGRGGDDVDVLLNALTSSVQSRLPESAAAGAGATAAAPPVGAAAAAAAATAQIETAAAVLGYVRHLRATQSLAGGGSSRMSGFGAGVSTAMTGFGIPGAGAGGKLVNLASHILNKAAASVNRMVQGELRRPVTRVIQAVCEGRPAAAAPFPLETCLTLDPRGASSNSGRGGGGGSGDRTYGAYAASAAAASGAAGGGAGSAPTFRNAFVFTVGGGTYPEYHDVLAYAASCSPPRTIVYGATEVLSAGGFLAQLESLGRASPGAMMRR